LAKSVKNGNVQFIYEKIRKIWAITKMFLTQKPGLTTFLPLW